MSIFGYSLNWSAEDKEFVGTCSAYPSLSCLHSNPLVALFDIIWLSNHL